MSALRVALVWNGEPLEDRVWDRPAPVRIGQGGGVDFAVPPVLLGSESHLLLEPSGNGYLLHVAPGMIGELNLAGRRIDVRERLGQAGGTQHVGLGDWGIVGLGLGGQVALFFELVSMPDYVGRGPRWLDRYVTQAIAMSAVAHAALLLGAFALWEPNDEMDVDPPPSALIARILEEQRRPNPAPPPTAAATEDKRVREAERQAARRPPGADGVKARPGDSEPTRADARPNRERAEVVSKVSQLGLLGTLKATRGQSQALRKLLSDSDSGLSAALAGVRGAGSGSGEGAGPATRGTGPGGGGPGPLVGVGTLSVGGRATTATPGPARTAAEVKVSMTEGTPTTEGGLSREQILKVVQSHRAAIQFCYEKELQRFPNLQGKVQLGWVIDGDGRVSSARLDSSSLGNAGAEGCMLRQVRAWTFPKTGSRTEVRFPFLFKGR